MASGGMWTASSSVGNATCSWPQEALNSSTGSFKPISKWRILRSVFNCTRMWRYVGRQAQNLRVRFTLELQYRSIEVNQDLATSNPSYPDRTLPRNMSESGKGGSFKPISKWRILRSVFNCTRMWRYVGRQAQNLRVRYTLELQYRSIEENQDLATSNPSYPDRTLPRNMSESGKGGGSEKHICGKARHGCSMKSCNSQDLMLFGQFFKPCMIVFPQSNCTPGTTLVVVAIAVVALSLECDQYPTDHVDWGGLGTSYLFGTPLESKNACVSIVTLFQAASILLFQAAYFWLKFREASTSGRKRKVPDLQDVQLSCDQSSRGVYARAIKDKGTGNVVGHKYEPRFKPPRERNAQGKVLSFQNLSLGSYNDPRDAEIVRQIAAFYYDKDKDVVSLGDGRSFRIPAVSLHGLSGNEKAKWVTDTAKKVFEKYCNPNSTERRPQSGNLSSSSVHTSFYTSFLNHEFPQISPVTLTDQIAHHGPSLPDPNLRFSNEQLGMEVEKHTISELVIQHTGVESIDNMVVDKEGDSTLQAVDQSTQSLTQLTGPWRDAADEQLNTIAWDIGEFLLEDPEDVVPGKRALDSLHQSQGIVGKLAYCQLQPHFPPHCSTPCTTTTHRQSLSDPVGQSCLQFQSSEGGAGTPCKWGMDHHVLTSEGGAVQNSHCHDASVPSSSSMRGSTPMAPALARATLSLRTTNFCSGNCVTDLLQEVNRLQKQIEELKLRANEFLKNTSGLKCSFCCSPLH